MKIAIVDSGGANLASVKDALERLGVEGELTADARKIRAADKVLLPGVGSAADAMERLKARGLVETLRGLKRPALGICLGMQLLFESSDEGPTPCLGVLPGAVAKIRADAPIPHMGWNRLATDGKRSPLLAGIEAGSFFYFVHSYRGPWGDWVRGWCEYGERIPAVVEKDNFFGVQFHPERSGAAGARLLGNFLAL